MMMMMNMPIFLKFDCSKFEKFHQKDNYLSVTKINYSSKEIINSFGLLKK